MKVYKDAPWWTNLYALFLIAGVAIAPNLCSLMTEEEAGHAWVVYLTLMHAGAALLCRDIAMRTHPGNHVGTFWFASETLDEITMGNLWKGNEYLQWWFLGTMVVTSLVWQLWDILRKR